MAKVIIAGDAVVVKSAIKYEDLKAVKKYRPEALTLKGGEDGKEPIFSVFVKDSGAGSINANATMRSSHPSLWLSMVTTILMLRSTSQASLAALLPTSRRLRRPCPL